MRKLTSLLLACVAVGIAGCQGNAPAPPTVSNAVRMDSGISATGSAGQAGGALAAPSGAGTVVTSPVR